MKTPSNPYNKTTDDSSTSSSSIPALPPPPSPPPVLGSTPLSSSILPKLRPFQLSAVKTAISPSLNARFLLGDEMGLGKTVTSLAIMAHYSSLWTPLLIICPPSLRYMWPSEIETFLPSLPPDSVRVVQSFSDTGWAVRTKDGGYSVNPAVKVLVITYSLLRVDTSSSALANILARLTFPCVICDESHHLKTPTSQKTQATQSLVKRATHVIMLSGTPALSRPVELYGQLSSLSPEVFGSYDAFTKKFCDARRGRFGWDVGGSSNERELNELLRTVMIRRLKKDVLQDLPAKTRRIVEIPAAKGTAVGKAAAEAIKAWQSLGSDPSSLFQSDGSPGGGEAPSSTSAVDHFEARRQMMQAYQLGGVAKVGACCDYIDEWLASAGTEKVLLFAHHKEVMDALEERVVKYLAANAPRGAKKNKKKHIRIDGGVSPKERQAGVKAFQEDPDVRVAVLSITAAGVGLTLTAASNAIFVEVGKKGKEEERRPRRAYRA